MKKKVTCGDCIHAGVIYYNPSYEYDDLRDLRKACPKGYLFDHPNPLKCPNFVQRERRRT